MHKSIQNDLQASLSVFQLFSLIQKLFFPLQSFIHIHLQFIHSCVTQAGTESYATDRCLCCILCELIFHRK